MMSKKYSAMRDGNNLKDDTKIMQKPRVRWVIGLSPRDNTSLNKD